MAQVRLTAPEMQGLGLRLVGFDADRQARTCQETNKERFRASYGLEPLAYAKILTDLQETNVDAARVARPNPTYLLMMGNWVKCGRTQPELAGIFKKDEKTVRKWNWFYLGKVRALKAAKIIWGDFPAGVVFIVSVDGVHCKTSEDRRNPTSRRFSHKFAGPALAYELALAIHREQLVWINGPFLASTHDITIFRMPGGLGSRMPIGCRAIGDSGYRGEPDKVSVINPTDAPDVLEFKNRVRARHEKFNGRIKTFRILTSFVDFDLAKHVEVFEAICVMCQYDLENGNSLFA